MLPREIPRGNDGTSGQSSNQGSSLERRRSWANVIEAARQGPSSRDVTSYADTTRTREMKEIALRENFTTLVKDGQYERYAGFAVNLATSFANLELDIAKNGGSNQDHSSR